MRTSPRSVPELSAGAHLCPEDGACLMEAVAQHAGRPWSDHPSCTHPLVAHVARLVNDASSHEARQRLLGDVPTLAAAYTDDMIAYPRVALACTEVACRQHPTLLLMHLEHVALAELRRETAASSECAGAGVPSRMWRRLYQRGPAVRAVEQSVAVLLRMPQRERDRALAELLARAVDAVCASPIGRAAYIPHDHAAQDG